MHELTGAAVQVEAVAVYSPQASVGLPVTDAYLLDALRSSTAVAEFNAVRDRDEAED